MSHSMLRFIPDVLVKRRPIHLTLFLTRRCNAACPFCFYSAGSTSSAPELTLDEISRASRSMGPLLWLALSGGEIYLRDDLPAICETFHTNNRPSIILLPTNGLMPDRIRSMTGEALARCPGSIVTVKVSIDGPAPTHDRLRSVPGAYDKALATLDALAPLLDHHPNFELGVNTVFCADNQREMDATIDLVAALPMVHTHTISLVRGDTRNPDQRAVDLSLYEAAIERLASAHRHRSYRFTGARIKAAQDVLQRRLIHATATAGARQLPCFAGRLNLVITESGELYPCESFTPDLLLGNIRDHACDVSECASTLRSERIIQRISKECFCTHECYMMTNILFNPLLYPRLLKTMLQP